MNDNISKAEVLETYAELYEIFDDYPEICKEISKVYNKINSLQEQKPSWISVKDRLPEEDTDVLVANGMGIEIAAYTTNPVKQWYGMNGQDVYAKYWTPLPEPPKEEEHG